MNQHFEIVAIVPAAGCGSRMQAARPKQYLQINQQSILEHTVYRLLSHPRIAHVIVVISAQDDYFHSTSLAQHANVSWVNGAAERADSVLAGLQAATSEWVMVHDAARPCVRHSDIDALIDAGVKSKDGALLAMPARDTIKQEKAGLSIATLDRAHIWQALTPQLFLREPLIDALLQAKKANLLVTDEASAMELAGKSPRLVAGRSDNIKVTVPEDLALATFFLQQYEE